MRGAVRLGEVTRTGAGHQSFPSEVLNAAIIWPLPVRDGQGQYDPLTCDFVDGCEAGRALNNWLRQAAPIFDQSLALEILRFGPPDAHAGRARR